jgi:hypothetical protein
VLINLNEAEVKFALYSIQEMAQKLQGKLTENKGGLPVLDLLKNAPPAVRLTKAGRPAKKPGRKPGKKPAVKIVEQQAA